VHIDLAERRSDHTVPAVHRFVHIQGRHSGHMQMAEDRSGQRAAYLQALVEAELYQRHQTGLELIMQVLDTLGPVVLYHWQ
jgi:hypothetical protein